MYKYQHVYLPVLYGLLAIKFRMQDVTDTFMTYVALRDFLLHGACVSSWRRHFAVVRRFPNRNSNGAVRVNYFDTWVVRLLAVKVFWLTWRVILPLAVFGVPAGQFLALFLVAELASGYWLAFNFQVRYTVCCDVGASGALLTRSGAT